MTTHVITFEVGAVLEDEKWQAPPYCFTDEAQVRNGSLFETFELGGSLSKLMRGTYNAVDVM